MSKAAEALRSVGAAFGAAVFFWHLVRASTRDRMASGGRDRRRRRRFQARMPKDPSRNVPIDPV